ncbi:MAG: GDSL-type esterase/lipase family protein [Parabacteroides sp.]|nr:GDSL-type esterase/lipase family protein [Parabacteroides sp.]
MTKQIKQLGNILIIVLLTGLGLYSPWLRGAAAPVRMPDEKTPLPADTLRMAPEASPLTPEEPALPFYIDSLCVLTGDARALEPFYRQLAALRQGKDTVISVVHLGDSHIQCGFLTGHVMRLFHRDFGNAGRGLIVPLKLTRTNEPDDYFIRSTVTDWLKGRCIQAEPKCPVGIGGIGIRTEARKINMEVIIARNNGAGYGFNQAVLFRDREATPLIATGVPANGVKTVTGRRPVCADVVCDTVRFDRLTDTLLLRSHMLPARYNNLYYGLNLTNGAPGVLYHSIGVNGAMFVNYTDSAYVKQLALLEPSLLIVSMGTNETFGRRFNASEFKGQVARLVGLLRTYLPNTVLVLTTPPECFQRKSVNKKPVYQRNPNTGTAAGAIAGLAAEEGIPCWDLYRMTGGQGSSGKWLEAGLFGRDRIHFTKEAYREQGKLLYRALVKGYNGFINSREATAGLVE